jgi:hypothetical protein
MLYQDRIDPTRLIFNVFIDGNGTKIATVRRRGWAPLGQRRQTKAPHGDWKTLTFLAAPRLDRVEGRGSSFVQINGQRLRLYIEKVLVDR